MKLAILVTHLLGSGHLARAAMLARGFTDAGHEALLISGGAPVPHLTRGVAVAQLPPLRADGPGFRAMLGADGEPMDEALAAARIEAIREALAQLQPDALITELFPFGRRKLAAEFLAAIEAAQGARVYCSIRDILQLPRKPGRKEEAEARFAAHYHGALFHGADALAPLEDSWPLPQPLRGRVFETGYIGDAAAPDMGGSDGHGEIIVAAGGGAVGDRLFGAAIDASQHGERRWRLLIGGHDRIERIAAFRQSANAIIEPVRPDFRALLKHCDLAVLQCGYNTALDVAATGARALFCPFEQGGETEQVARAGAMQARFGSGLIRERDLSGEALAQAAKAALNRPAPDYSGLGLDGAARSVRILEDQLS